MSTKAIREALEEAAHRADIEAQESHTREVADVLDDVARRIRALKSTPARVVPCVKDAVAGILALHDRETPVLREECAEAFLALRRSYDAFLRGGE